MSLGVSSPARFAGLVFEVIPSDQLAIPVLLLAGTTRQPLDQVPRRECVERGLSVQVMKAEHPIGPLLELARGLLAPEHQDREDRDLILVQRKLGVE